MGMVLYGLGATFLYNVGTNIELQQSFKSLTLSHYLKVDALHPLVLRIEAHKLKSETTENHPGQDNRRS